MNTIFDVLVALGVIICMGAIAFAVLNVFIGGEVFGTKIE